MSEIIQDQFKRFYDIDGQPLENGNVYIGVAGLDPVANPISVFWDEDLTIAASQPIKTLNGAFSNGGTIGNIFTESSDYSISVNNKNNSVVYSSLLKTKSGSNITSMNLLPSNWADGDSIRVNSFFADIEGGGGDFYWDADGDKANHDGGTIIDPLKSSTDLTSTSVGATYFNTNTGSGVWVRSYDKNLINVRWFGAKGDNIANDGPVLQQVINKFANSNILLAGETSVFRIEQQITIPNSASYTLIGNTSIQTNDQTTISSAYNGQLFFSPGGETVFESYKNIRFLSNYNAYPNSQAIVHQGESVYCQLENITFQGFGLQCVATTGATNVCKFNNILGFANNDYIFDLNNCVSCNFDRLVVDNNLGGGYKVLGASCSFSNLYSENSCQRNVTEAATFREFYFAGGTFDIGPINLNSYAGNSVVPIELNACNNTVIKCVRQLSGVTPSYSYEITNGPTGLSSFTLVSSLGIRVENPTDNVIIIDAGYTGFDPDLSVNAVSVTPEEGTWTPVFTNMGTGTYTSNVGTYSKIGNLVFVTCEIDIDTVGTASGSLQVSGLPFAISSTPGTSPSSSSVVGASWAGTVQNLAGTGVVGGTTINIVKDTGSPSLTAATHADIGTGLLNISLTYKVA